jgi:hypothetical protein
MSVTSGWGRLTWNQANWNEATTLKTGWGNFFSWIFNCKRHDSWFVWSVDNFFCGCDNT